MRFKKSICLFLLLVLIISCHENKKNKIISTPVSDTISKGIVFHKLEKRSVIGDFDGDGKQDTIFEHNYSKEIKTEILESPDLYENDWEIVENWFYTQKADLYLIINKKNQDTLHLGTAQGLYCLINIGDNNNDGKDEIALVIDRLDLSRVNSCKIYSLCDKKWTTLKEFGIHEDSFDFTSDRMPIFNEIKGYLEKRNGKWFYNDYSQNSYDTQEEIGKMKRLKPSKCNY